MSGTRSTSRVLLLDLYASSTRPLIQPFMYLSSFLGESGIDTAIYRWQGDEQALCAVLHDLRPDAVFMNAILGPVLGLVEPVSRVVRRAVPQTRIWLGGAAVHFLRDELVHVDGIDRVTLGSPACRSEVFRRELATEGLRVSPPGNAGTPFPLLAANPELPRFLHAHERGGEEVRSISMSLSGGCPNRCSFCYQRLTPPWEWPIPHAVTQVSELHRRHDVRYFEFSDDNLFGQRDRFLALASALADLKADISWFGLASADSIDRKVLDAAVASGLNKLFIGVDGLGHNVLKELGKNYGPERARQALELVREYPIDLTLGLVLGSPGETEKDLEELYDWVCDVRPEICFVFFLTPYPGTPTYEKSQKLGFVGPDTLAEWGEAMDPGQVKSWLNPQIGEAEYQIWRKRFEALSTRKYRSGIGESVRRIRRNRID